MTDTEYLKKYLPSDKLDFGLELLKQGIPVQYIVGNVDFYGIELEVNPSVLIPRFETELLVEKTINYVKKYLREPLRIIDLGTGSGAIAIALGKYLDAKIDAIDISLEALDVAQRNAVKNDVDINFYKSDMLSGVDGKYDLIISNPPYISGDEVVEDIVKNNEPSTALYADNGGLEFYEKILGAADSHLNDKGIIAFEIGFTQGEAVKNIAEKYFYGSKITIEKDLTGRDRYVFIFKN